MKKTKTTIVLTISLIIALLAISIFVFLMQIIKNKNTNIQSVYATLEQKTLEKSQIDTIKKNNDYIKQSQDKINSYFVDTTDISIFINYLEDIGSQGGVKLTVDNVEVPKTDEKFVSVSVSLFGSFSNVMRTVRMIEHIPYKIHFNNIYINKYIPSQNQSDPTKKVAVPAGSSWEVQITFDALSSI